MSEPVLTQEKVVAIGNEVSLNPIEILQIKRLVRRFDLKVMKLDESNEIDRLLEAHLPQLAAVCAIKTIFVFNRERLEDTRPLLFSMSKDTAINFRRGGGYFGDFCRRADGTEWTTSYDMAEVFLGLLLGLGIAKFCAPRRLWDTFSPHGLPWVLVEGEPEQLPKGLQMFLNQASRADA